MLVKCDITNFKLLENIFTSHKIDKIIHLAARAGVRPSIDEPVLYFNVNINGTLNLLELSRLNKIKTDAPR